jgi:hypothetical protein
MASVRRGAGALPPIWGRVSGRQKPVDCQGGRKADGSALGAEFKSFSLRLALDLLGLKRRKAPSNGPVAAVITLLLFPVDKARSRSLYTTHRRAVPQVTARWRASETPHWFSENASDCIRKHEFRWRVWMPCRPRQVGIARFPGCLTSESEERETWTAGSLRTAVRVEAIQHGYGRKRLLTVYVFTKVHCWSFSRVISDVDLVKT